VRLLERDDRGCRIHLLGRVRIGRRLDVELTGANEAFESGRHIAGRSGFLEDEIGELLQGAELLVEPRQALAETCVVWCGHPRALEAATCVGETAGLLAGLEELQRGADDAFAVFETDEAAVRGTRGVPASFELVDVGDRAERRLVLAVRLEQLGEDVACFLDIADVETKGGHPQAMGAPEGDVAAAGGLEGHLAEVFGKVGAQILLALSDGLFEVCERAVHLVEAAAEERAPADEVGAKGVVRIEQLDRGAELVDRALQLAGCRERVDELDEEEGIARLSGAASRRTLAASSGSES